MPSEVTTGWTEGCVVKMSYLAKVMVTTCQVHLPSSPTTGSKTKESSASEVRLGALPPLLFCEYLLFKALNNSKVVAWYTSLGAISPWIPARSQPGDPAGVGDGGAHASPWQQCSHSPGNKAEQPSLLLLTPVPALANSLCMILAISAATTLHIFAP